jgi:hypothetical protein
MTKVLQIPGRFRYRALAVPKGARNERFVLLHGPMLVEIADASEVMRRDAVRVRTCSGTEISYGLHDGRLWRPAFPEDPLTVEDYARAAAAWPTVERTHSDQLQHVDHALRGMRADPVASASEFREQSPWPERGDMTLYDEATFEGRIVAHDRFEQLSRCLAAARHLAVVDDIVHVAVPDPVWELGFEGRIRLIAPIPASTAGSDFSPHDGGRVVEGWRCFDVRRLDAVQEFARLADPDRAHPVEGGLLHASADYVSPPALSRAVQGAFYYVLRSNHGHEIHRHLSSRGLRAAAALQAAAETTSTHSLGDLASDPRELLEGLRDIAAELRSGMWSGPTGYSQERLCGLLDRVIQRADFERNWGPAMAPEDEASLGALAP